mmetsp:Transcript_6677/g.16339  ORF Transcript_6677/g.16339 Transcript_6677/m.16339 type:complete len:121 (-) Transcript_6677:123-485(-)
MVCGADLVERVFWRKWESPAMPPKVVIHRQDSHLPVKPPGKGWYVVHADVAAGDVSSTLVRKAISAGRWDDLTSNGWITTALRDFLEKRYAERTLLMQQESKDSAHTGTPEQPCRQKGQS